MILDKIIASTKIRVAKAKENLSPSELLKALDKAELKVPNFKNGLVSIDDVSIIAEIKKASPSKGLIRGDFDHMKIAEEYDKCNIQAMSVLTEPEYFKGNIEFVKDIKSKFSIPVLRKDCLLYTSCFCSNVRIDVFVFKHKCDFHTLTH